MTHSASPALASVSDIDPYLSMSDEAEWQRAKERGEDGIEEDLDALALDMYGQ